MCSGDFARRESLLKKQLTDDGLDYFVAYADGQYFQKAVEIVTKLRRKGLGANFSYKSANLGKQLKEASAQNAKKCVIVGSEIEKGELAVKDMSSGTQELVRIDKFLT